VATNSALLQAFTDLSNRYAELLRNLGEVRVLALDPCPRCMGRVIATDTTARCASGCGWTYRIDTSEPIASRRADA
jgi:hypothetical protein